MNIDMRSPDDPEALPDQALAALVDAYLRFARRSGSKKSHLIDAFLWAIEKGIWQPGQRVPTERELTEALPLSLGTIQAAVRSLVDAGIVERKAGVGTHVVDLSHQEGDRWFLRFLDPNDDAKSFVSLEILDAEIGETHEPGPWRDFLGACPSYVRISRTIEVAGQFKTRAQVYLDGASFRPLLDFDLRVIRQLHIRQILHDRFNMPTRSRRTRMRFFPIEGDIATALGIDEGTQGIALEVSSTTLRDAPLSFQRFVIPPNRFLLDVKSD